MTSQTAGSGPIAVRSMPMLRDAAFNLRESIPSGIGETLGAIAGTIKEAQVLGNATPEVGA
jgi:hypothetical protein